jgi:hypothetical protein
MVHNPLIVARTIRLAVPAEQVPVLAGIPGVTAARTDAGGRLLHVSYDLHQLGYGDIIRILSATGLTPAGGFAETMKRRWFGFTERNLVDQSKTIHHCGGTPAIDRITVPRRNEE